MSIVVYSKPACAQCTATHHALSQRGITYRAVDISEDAEGFSLVQELGYRQVPVIVTETDHWSGFRPDKITALAGRVAAA